MKVFISWSGEPSKSIARALREWLPTIAQHVRPWMSDEEIRSGTRWNDQVSKALNDTDFGIVCVTASNQHQPWLMFESGALAKRLEVGRLVPLCIDLRLTEVTGPLDAFQGRTLDEDGMRKLVHDVMAQREDPPPPASTDKIFQAMWPMFETQVNDAKQQAPDPRDTRRSSEDMLEEIVERVRRLDRGQNRYRVPLGSLWPSVTENTSRLADLMEFLRERDIYIFPDYSPDKSEERIQLLQELVSKFGVKEEEKLNENLTADENDAE